MGIAQDGHNLWKIDVTRQISQDVAHPSKSAGPRVGSLLLVSRRVVHDESSKACLDCLCTVSKVGLAAVNWEITGVDCEVQDVNESNREYNCDHLNSM